MNCNSVQRLLDAHRTNETLPDDGAAIMTHLAACSKCRDAFDRLMLLASRSSVLSIKAPRPLESAVLKVVGDGFGEVETDLGRTWVGFNSEGLTLIDLRSETADSFVASYYSRLGRSVCPGDVPSRLIRAVQFAANGQPVRKVPVSLTHLPDFERKVLKCLQSIPLGEVRPYAWLAREAGSPGAVRAVGTIMARNPIPLVLPCHRVTPSSGGVGRYGYGTGMKRTLLEREGVETEELDAAARKHLKYIGSRTTGIYCYPTCRNAKRISWENRMPFRNEKQATTAGYRPCKHCRPLAA